MRGAWGGGARSCRHPVACQEPPASLRGNLGQPPAHSPQLSQLLTCLDTPTQRPQSPQRVCNLQAQHPEDERQHPPGVAMTGGTSRGAGRATRLPSMSRRHKTLIKPFLVHMCSLHSKPIRSVHHTRSPRFSASRSKPHTISLPRKATFKATRVSHVAAPSPFLGLCSTWPCLPTSNPLLASGTPTVPGFPPNSTGSVWLLRWLPPLHQRFSTGCSPPGDICLETLVVATPEVLRHLVGRGPGCCSSRRSGGPSQHGTIRPKVDELRWGPCPKGWELRDFFLGSPLPACSPMTSFVCRW